jgi:hypothetical protein
MERFVWYHSVPVTSSFACQSDLGGDIKATLDTMVISVIMVTLVKDEVVVNMPE